MRHDALPQGHERPLLDDQRTDNLQCGNYFKIPWGVLNPMQWPLRNKKIRNITVIVLFLINGLAALFLMHYESPAEKAIREWSGAAKTTPWLLYVALIGGACVVYLFFFKVEEGRQRYLAIPFISASFICLTLLPSFQWRWAIALAIMLAIALIGWLYPARNTD